jgi:hypothetical protein
MKPPAIEMPSPPVFDRNALDRALYRLLELTLQHERLVNARDREILSVGQRHARPIEAARLQISTLEAEIQANYLANRQRIDPEGAKAVELQHGVVGTRAATTPALIPLSSKFTWKAIEGKVRKLWKSKYFHKPKPPALDKNKLKKGLSAEQLAKAGLKLDDSETFYLELNRLANPAEQKVAA